MPDHFDKEFVRLWFKSRCDPYHDKEIPTPPDSLLIELSRRYIEMYEKITNEKFKFSFKKENACHEINQSIKDL